MKSYSVQYLLLSPLTGESSMSHRGEEFLQFKCLRQERFPVAVLEITKLSEPLIEDTPLAVQCVAERVVQVIHDRSMNTLSSVLLSTNTCLLSAASGTQQRRRPSSSVCCQWSHPGTCTPQPPSHCFPRYSECANRCGIMSIRFIFKKKQFLPCFPDAFWFPCVFLLHSLLAARLSITS